MSNASADNLLPFVESAVQPGSTVVTDGWPSYDGLARRGYRHLPKVIAGSGKEANVLLPRVHMVASLLKRWLLGTHQGALRAKHLEYYLDEFTFRFNRRTSRHRGKLFVRLLENAVQLDPVPYEAIVRVP